MQTAAKLCSWRCPWDWGRSDRELLWIQLLQWLFRFLLSPSVSFCIFLILFFFISISPLISHLSYSSLEVMCLWISWWHLEVFFVVVVFVSVLGVKFETSCMLGKCPTTGLQSQSQVGSFSYMFFQRKNYPMAPEHAEEPGSPGGSEDRPQRCQVPRQLPGSS